MGGYADNVPLAVAVARLAECQHGVVTRAQLLAAGLGEDQIDSWARNGRLHRRYRGVFAVGREDLSRPGEWLAAVWACGPGAVLSHWSAAALHGMAEEPDGEVHVTTPARRRIERRPGLAVHCTRNLGPEDVVTLGRIPTTRQPRTLLDLADVVAYQTLRAIADDQRRLDPDALLAAQARAPNKAGAPSIARLLEAGRHHTRSEFERRFLRFCAAQSVTRPDATNVMVGRHRVDALYVRQRLAVELDGRATHARRTQMRQDRLRDGDLQLAGVRVLRLVWEDLDRDEAERTAARVRALLAAGPHQPHEGVL